MYLICSYAIKLISPL